MPIYVYRCDECGVNVEMLREIEQRDTAAFCPSCQRLMYRAYGEEVPIVRSDIEPHFDKGMGEYVSSRRHLREILAKNNAYNPDLMMNDTPSAGHLTPEERAVEESGSVPKQETIFDKRKRPGWGQNPSDADKDITVEGTADYSQIRNYVLQRSGYDPRTLRRKQ